MSSRRNQRPRRGSVTIEFIVVLPILVIVVVASIQFGIIALYQSAVVHSAGVAAREAGKGADLAAVVDAVEETVGIYGIAIDSTPGSGAKVVLEQGTSTPQSAGDPDLDCDPPFNLVAAGEVRVTVCVDLLSTQFIDALAAWGLTFQGAKLRGSALVSREP